MNTAEPRLLCVEAAADLPVLWATFQRLNPGRTYREWVEALRTIVRDRSERGQRKLFHDNTVASYRLG